MQKIGTLLFIVGLMLLASCNQRYWFRTKIDLANSKKYSVKISVVNCSPEMLPENFNAAMRHVSKKYLKRRGYYEVPIDSPQFHYTLSIKVDSFRVGGKPFYRRDIYSNSKNVKAILIEAKMVHYKKGWMQWENRDDIYYFGETRDVGRSMGVVRYLIRNAQPKQ
jgi:hypothetical protein